MGGQSSILETSRFIMHELHFLVITTKEHNSGHFQEHFPKDEGQERKRETIGQVLQVETK